jgi:uncharacterized membrane protein YfcA
MSEYWNPTHLDPLAWGLIAAGSFGFGLSKTGIPGVGILSVALFALVFETSPGVVLPLLIAADCIAGCAYFKFAQWPKMLRMFPWAALGIFCGYWLFAQINTPERKATAPATLNHIIGWILVVLVGLSFWWRWLRRQPADPEAGDKHGLAFEIVTGILAGFTTMIANAAGPIMILYLLRMKLPKMQFIGTCSCFFLVLNCFKVPFMIHNGMMTAATFRIDVQFIPFSLLGSFFGWAVILWINQSVFESLCLVFTLMAAIWLVH